MKSQHLGIRRTLDFADAKRKIACGEVQVFIDKVRALTLAGSGLPVGILTYTINGIFLVAFFAVVPLWIFVGFRSALLALIVGIVSFRWARSRVVQCVYNYAFKDEETFIAFQKAMVIWFREINDAAAESNDIKNTLNAIDDLYSFFDKNEDIHLSICIEDALSAAKKVVQEDKENTIHSISRDGWKPRDLALLIISKTANAALITGNHHIYRGVLSNKGNGYLTIFSKAVRELVESGFFTQEEAERDLKDIREEIKSLG